MRTTAKVLAVKDRLAKIEVSSQVNPLRAGDVIRIQRGALRSMSQNALLWTYYHWLINEGGLKEQGFFSESALHENLKVHFLSEKIMDKGEFKAIETASTTDLNKLEFGEFFDKVDHFMQDFFGLDTAPFWTTYRRDYAV